MPIYRLILAEIRHRWLLFWLATCLVALVVAYTVNTYVKMQREFHRQQARVASLDDEIRQITKAMGFNINILPRSQNLVDFYAEDFAQETMPYEYVERLAQSRDAVTLNHLRPALIGKMQWSEARRQVILMGVTGVIPWAHRKSAEQPLSEPVTAGTIHLGGVLAKELNHVVGDRVLINGTEFRVAQVYALRGNKDDITIWTDLAWAQQALSKPGRINLIQALECNCASIDRLAEIETEIGKILGDEVQVVELATTAIARARARTEVATAGSAALVSLRQYSWTSTIASVLTAVGLIAGLTILNVRQRQAEIGLLRAIGAPTSKILGLFLGKSLLIGVVGGSLGFVGGLLWGLPAGGDELSGTLSWSKLGQLGLLVLMVSPLVTSLASWLPALLATQQDPAEILRRDLS